MGPVEHTPFGMAAVTDRVRRLHSTGPGGAGRPADPAATIPCIVKFKPKTWRLLARVAREQARLTGRRVSPAQVASILIDETVSDARGRGRSRRQAQ